MKSILLPAILSAFMNNGMINKKHSPIEPPTKCPSESSISQHTLDYVLPIWTESSNIWVGIKQKQKFDTNDYWTLWLYDHEATMGSNNKDALKYLNSLMRKAQLLHPDPIEGYDFYACLYGHAGNDTPNDPEKEFMVAFYPAPY